MVLSIETLFFIVSPYKDWTRGNFLNMDKDFQTKWSFQQIQLVRSINRCTISVRLTDETQFNIKRELYRWHKHCKSFTIIQGVIFCWTLKHWDNTSLYAQFLFNILRTSVNRSIRSCRQIAINNKQIEHLLAISKEVISIDDTPTPMIHITGNRNKNKRNIARI